MTFRMTCMMLGVMSWGALSAWAEKDADGVAKDAAEVEPASLRLKLVTFNIRMPSKDDGPNVWRLRKELFFDTVRQLDPDVMGVQEAYASQLKEMLAALEGYAFVGVGRDDGKEDGEHSAIFYRKSRFDVGEQGTFWLSDTPHVVASNTWDAACNRVCTWIALRDQKTKRPFAVYNAHYDHRSAKARENSPVVIVEQIQAKKHDKIPLVLMGDFNSGPDSSQMRYLLEGKATLDGKERASPVLFQNTLPEDVAKQSATFNGWRGRVKGRQIDYVLIGERKGRSGRVIESAINRAHSGERYPSDHYPVTATVEFP